MCVCKMKSLSIMFPFDFVLKIKFDSDFVLKTVLCMCLLCIHMFGVCLTVTASLYVTKCLDMTSMCLIVFGIEISDVCVFVVNDNRYNDLRSNMPIDFENLKLTCPER